MAKRMRIESIRNRTPAVVDEVIEIVCIALLIALIWTGYLVVNHQPQEAGPKAKITLRAMA